MEDVRILVLPWPAYTDAFKIMDDGKQYGGGGTIVVGTDIGHKAGQANNRSLLKSLFSTCVILDAFVYWLHRTSQNI